MKEFRQIVVKSEGGEFERVFIHEGCGGRLILCDVSYDIAFGALGAKKSVFTGVSCKCEKCGKRIYVPAYYFER